MLADQDHPLEDAIAEAEAKPDPALVVVYRTRGVPWLLVPPLLLLAGVAAIVIYRRSAEVADRAAAHAWRDASTDRTTIAAAPKPDTRARVDALDELTSATGRPTSVPSSPTASVTYDPTPPSDEPQSPKLTPAAVVPAAEPARVVEKPKVEETRPTAPEPAPSEPKTSESKPAPTKPKSAELKTSEVVATPDRAVAAASAAAARPNVVADPFDPLVEIPEPAKPVPIEPAPAGDPTSRRDRVGFDPQATPATLEAPTEPKPEREPPAAVRPAGPNLPPAGESPFELDRRAPDAGGRAADRRAEQTQEAERDEQAEAERRLAERVHLEGIKNDFLNPDPAEYRRQREVFKARVRQVSTEERPKFHEELKRLIREQGRAAGPDIKAIRDRFGVDTLPEIMMPAARDLLDVGPRLDTGQKIRRMRQWGLPEPMIIDDLYEKELRNIGARGGARNEDEAWVFAAWALLHYPPGVPRANAQPAAAPPR